MVEQSFKRRVAYKFTIGKLLEGAPVFEGERLLHLSLDGKEVVRVNLIANITDKYLQEGEKKYGTLTLDDASGQIQLRFFGDDVVRMENLNQGDTVLIIGLVRSWNDQVYITPEIIKKQDPKFLLVRKLETEMNAPKIQNKENIRELKDKIITLIKEAEPTGGIGVDKIIMQLKDSPDVINQEIRKLLEDGLAYEPRPGTLRYLG